MKIGEVANQAGVTVDTVRFYERVGVLPPPPARHRAIATTNPTRSGGSGSPANSRRSASRSPTPSTRSPPTTPAAPPASPSNGASTPSSPASTPSSPSSTALRGRIVHAKQACAKLAPRALEVVVRRPVPLRRESTLVAAGSGPRASPGVGDGVVEAVGLDASGRPAARCAERAPGWSGKRAASASARWGAWPLRGRRRVGARAGGSTARASRWAALLARAARRSGLPWAAGLGTSTAILRMRSARRARLPPRRG